MYVHVERSEVIPIDYKKTSKLYFYLKLASEVFRLAKTKPAHITQIEQQNLNFT